MRLNQARQVIGCNNAKAHPLHLSCDEQASTKDAASLAKGMQHPTSRTVKHARRAGWMRTKFGQQLTHKVSKGGGVGTRDPWHIVEKQREAFH
jgi:hypothetical protein